MLLFQYLRNADMVCVKKKKKRHVSVFVWLTSRHPIWSKASPSLPHSEYHSKFARIYYSFAIWDDECSSHFIFVSFFFSFFISCTAPETQILTCVCAWGGLPWRLTLTKHVLMTYLFMCLGKEEELTPQKVWRNETRYTRNNYTWLIHFRFLFLISAMTTTRYLYLGFLEFQYSGNQGCRCSTPRVHPLQTRASCQGVPKRFWPKIHFFDQLTCRDRPVTAHAVKNILLY